MIPAYARPQALSTMLLMRNGTTRHCIDKGAIFNGQWSSALPLTEKTLRRSVAPIPPTGVVQLSDYASPKGVKSRSVPEAVRSFSIRFGWDADSPSVQASGRPSNPIIASSSSNDIG